MTKLPNENIQNYQLEMFDSQGGCKLPNANCDQIAKWKYPKLPTSNVLGGGVSKLPNTDCDQTTKWKYPKLPTRNDQFWEGGGVNYQVQIVTKLPNENIQNYQLEMFESGGGNYQMQIVTKLPNENIQKLPARNVWFW